jgi:hypothetical protein
MSKFDSPLINIKIASPCSADWNRMDGDERKRFCGDCKLNVYNLSGMTKYDAEHLLRMSEGRLCVRYFQRPDGTILTRDCPVGWARVKQRVSIFAAAAFSVILSLFGAMWVVSMFSRRAVVMGTMVPRATPTPTPAPLMGAVANVPRPTPKPREVKGEYVVGMRAAPTPTLVQIRKNAGEN